MATWKPDDWFDTRKIIQKIKLKESQENYLEERKKRKYMRTEKQKNISIVEINQISGNRKDPFRKQIEIGEREIMAIEDNGSTENVISKLLVEEMALPLEKTLNEIQIKNIFGNIAKTSLKTKAK